MVWYLESLTAPIIPNAPLRIKPKLAPAWGAEVVSSNIVGYEKVAVNKGWTMIGVQFNQVGGEPLDLGTVGVLDSSMDGFDAEGSFPNEMRVFDGTDYTYYGWSGSSGTDLLDNADLDNQWIDTTELAPVDEEMKPAQGFWIKSETGGTITLSGEVPTADTIQADVGIGWNMIANPYPGAVLVENFGTLDSTFAGFDAEGNFPNEMRVWDGENYAYYGWSGNSGSSLLDNPDIDNKWIDTTELAVTDDKIEFGKAVWIKASSSGKITFSKP